MRYLSKMIILFCSVLYSCTTQPAKSFEPRINHNRINCVAEPCDGSEASEEEPNQSGDTCMITAPEQREECTGVVKSEPYECGASIGQVVDAPQTLGAPLPSWTLQDLQPQSCGFERFYGLEAFRGTPVVAVLLWAGCGFCQKQAEKLQEMQFELKAMGLAVHFVIIDQANPNPPIELLTERCDFPIFQDLEQVDVWGLLDGKKDDFFFIDSEGILRNFIPSTEDINLSTDSGYQNIRSATLNLIAQDQGLPVMAGSEGGQEGVADFQAGNEVDLEGGSPQGGR